MGDQYARKFRFKPADTEDSQRYPLCDWCLGRVRATCDYIGFLRMIAAGHWRAETEEEKKSTWEESVRLRERMFWTRVGGGVVPSFIPLRDSPRSPTFSNGEQRMSEESAVSFEPRDITVDGPASAMEPRKSEEDPFRTKGGSSTKRISIGNTIISNDSTASDAHSTPAVQTEKETTSPIPTLSVEEEKQIEEEAQAQLHDEVRKSLDVQDATEASLKQQRQRSISNPHPPQAVQVKKKEERLSLMIPGSMPGGFD